MGNLAYIPPPISGVSSDILAGLNNAPNPLTGLNPVLDINTFMQNVVVAVGTVVSVSLLEAYYGPANAKYCEETETLYQYVVSGAAYAIDHLSVCATGAGGDTRWVGVFGKYSITDLRLKQSVATLTDSANVTPDFSASNNFSLSMLTATGASRNLKNPTSPTVGQTGFIDLVQDGSGGLTVVFDTYYVFPNETDPAQDKTANKTSTLVYLVKSASEIHCQYLPKWGRSA